MHELIMSSPIYINVAIGLPLEDPYTYQLSYNVSDDNLIGKRVSVSFQHRTMIGYVVKTHVTIEKEMAKKVKPILEIIDERPILNAAMINITQWMREYYLCSWGEAIENALPAYLKKKPKAISSIRLKELKGGSTNERIKADKKQERFTLTEEQEYAVGKIDTALDAKKFAHILLHGVTGSGKTEIYVRAIEKVLQDNKGAICLFPEIALTSHLEMYFRDHFAEDIVVLHSKLTPREKFIAWRDIYEGKKRVVIGPRSALFAPVVSLGLIVIDEDHENTYKQNETPRYDARTVAEKLAQECKALLISGGATPSLETMAKAQMGKAEYIRLTKRVVERPLPEVRIIDMRQEMRRGQLVLFSQLLIDAIESSLREKEGVLLFLNRRGFATSVQCPKCGAVCECKRCHVSMTYHQSLRRLVCHYCDTKKKVPDLCPDCSHAPLRFVGAGTERIESHIARLFPHARIARLDTDSVRKKGESERILNEFKSKRIDILIGTQMITKGFDFPHVTLVGVINADTMLTLPDFRSAERTFQLLTQVAGRAGRGQKKGMVIVQSFTPQHYAIRCAKEHDYETFYKEESAIRKELRYPPFSRLVNIIIRGRTEKSVRDFAKKMNEKVLAVTKDFHVDMLGPAPLPFFRLKGYYRWHIMIKGSISPKLLASLNCALGEFKMYRSVQFVVDVDPVNVL